MIIALVMVLSAIALYRAWPHGQPDPLEQGRAAYNLGDWGAAERAARARLRVRADDPDALRLMARASVHLGRTPAALAIFERLGPKAMLPDDLCQLGVALAKDGNTQGAIEVLRQALAAEPDHAEALVRLSSLDLAADRPMAAAELADRLERQPGWKTQAEILLGSIAKAQNDPAGAITHWQIAAKQPPEKSQGGKPALKVPPRDFARALLQSGQPSAAREFLQKASSAGPDAEISWLLRRAYLQEGAIKNALAADKESGTFRDDHQLMPEPARYVGSQACARCHSAIFGAQRRSRHARTFFSASELGHLDLPPSRFAEPAQQNVSHTLVRHAGGHLEQETRAGEKVFHAVVDYAFGSGDRGLTLVGHDDRGKPHELRLSHYRDKDRAFWDVTAGHAIRPVNISENLGNELTADAVRRCFLCHVTDPYSLLNNVGPVASEHGIGCEKCHGPGGNHLLAVAAKLADPAIVNPALVSGAAAVKLCAQCHSPLGRTVERDDPSAVRFQATTLTWSRCFEGSNDKLDCNTCHDPHRNVDTTLAHYEAKCLGCHSIASARPAGELKSKKEEVRPPEASGRTSCPVNPTKGCIGCHMPAVKDVVPHSTFTDHFIRVHRD